MPWSLVPVVVWAREKIEKRRFSHELPRVHSGRKVRSGLKTRSKNDVFWNSFWRCWQAKRKMTTMTTMTIITYLLRAVSFYSVVLSSQICRLVSRYFHFLYACSLACIASPRRSLFCPRSPPRRCKWRCCPTTVKRRTSRLDPLCPKPFSS